jgi:hypothetical protein
VQTCGGTMMDSARISRSAGQGGDDCVEVAACPSTVHVPRLKMLDSVIEWQEKE